MDIQIIEKAGKSYRKNKEMRAVDNIKIEKNEKSYRKNINKTGQCKHYPEVRCVCCNPECDHNCSVDDELEEMLENQLMDFL